MSDPVEFDHFIRDLVERFNDIFTSCDDLTIVCDKGNNSKDNLKLLGATPFHFVASLAPSHLKQVLEIPLEEYQTCKNKRLDGEKYCITRADVYGIERTVVLVYNPALFEGQLQGIMNNLNKTLKVLMMLKEKLAAWKGEKRKGRKPTAASVEKQEKRILCREYMKTLINYTVQEVGGWWVDLQYGVDQQAFDKLKATSLGKTILFSDREDWDAEQYILTYRDQYGIEHDFRQMKDPSWVSWDPLLHWTDQKIRVHAFYCFTALLISSLLKRDLQARKISISLPRAFEKLSKIQEVTITYPSSKRAKEPNQVAMLSEMDQEQTMLYDALGLDDYAVGTTF